MTTVIYTDDNGHDYLTGAVKAYFIGYQSIYNDYK
jgi:hypothetical protein